MAAPTVCAIGLMSGTSMDGIDAAVVIVSGDGERIVALGPCLSRPYAAATRSRIEAVLGTATAAARRSVSELLTRRHAEVVNELLAQCAPTFVPTLIGFHGQTVEHRPHDGVTVQLGDAALLATLTRLDVCSQFRTGDVLAGGEGAPLAPCYHAALLRCAEAATRSSSASASTSASPGAVALLNVGGVANFTYVGGDAVGATMDPRSSGFEMLIAADTGPGCALIDDFMLRRTGVPMDEGGVTAASGTVRRDVLASLFALGEQPPTPATSSATSSERLPADATRARAKKRKSNWFDLPPPKSLDRNTFAGALEIVDAACQSTADGAATLTAWTAECVARVVPHLPTQPTRWLVCGGGRRNAHLLSQLRAVLNRRDGAEAETEAEGGGPSAPRVVVVAVEEGRGGEGFHFRGDFIEAECFAFLAVRSVLGLPISYPRTTGVAAPTSGGTLTPYREDEESE
jgi:anhydro-N-acetylmuramic acid kinase